MEYQDLIFRKNKTFYSYSQHKYTHSDTILTAAKVSVTLHTSWEKRHWLTVKNVSDAFVRGAHSEVIKRGGGVKNGQFNPISSLKLRRGTTSDRTRILASIRGLMTPI